ncbi:MAG: Asp23/Gls24 family envelope stress response protein [Chloroflexi bacterium]|nr:Asp23/Gls24 family envelope stress response protein [Chloroflexota bacterium]
MTNPTIAKPADTIGNTTIAPSVLSTIAKLTTLAVPGVSRMAEDKLQITSPENEGVKVEIKDEQIYFDLSVVIASDHNARLVAETIQQWVNRAITEMVGMEVARIDVHINDVDIEI